MDMRQLRTFHRAATLLSFSRTAAELNYAQSSVTGQIKGLENALGVALFERLSGRRVRLTPAGRRLLPYAERLLLLAEEARSAASGSPEPSGRLVIGTMESIATYRMPPLLEFFHHRCPQLELVLRPGSGAEILDGLRQGALDLVLLIDTETLHPGLESTVFGPEPLVAVVAPDHELAGRRSATGERLRSVPILAPESGRGYRRLLEGEMDCRTAPILESGTVESTKRWAAAGLGVGLLPAVAVADDIAAGVLVPLDWRPPSAVYTQLVRRRRTPVSREMRLFIDQVSNLMAEENDQLAA
ncbi:LysR family transcriptional regulator [Streptomyces tubercidicus]|uniref:Putative HTH-type transcriptional regulator YwqM n=2 Tax=Streptomyces tubercidicus TaxID=47759 RepID=A0A640UVA3_9ACTN|nr:LysR family transcriptional regulator [Streptomyces tubercidicus]WAU13667.1 LysR family transcriptional regulator [Streptomyces tubercidicus]GFE39304.1 putative HTH-type transcriptional regulator YwqM [Streptomyces tubercidicus]